MAILSKSLNIKGMTCVSCESRIERKLKATEGILDANISYTKGTGNVSYDTGIINLDEILKIIGRMGYSAVEATAKAVNNKSYSKTNITKLIGIGIIIFALYMIADRFGIVRIFNAFPTAKEGMGYGMLFIIGILTSVHCVAMCGGINLSQCVPTVPVSGSGKLSSLRPSLLYNLGRVISYTVVGAIVGAIGSVVSFSGTMKGIVQLAAGVFMVIMGINMLNIFPWLRKLSPRMPKAFAGKVNQQKKGRGPLVVGLLNGLMPCGPLQSMQLYALSTGSALGGAVSMLLFSLGTVPLMFGLGALSSVLSKKFTSKMMTVSAYLVVVLGVFMFTNGMSLSGLDVSFPTGKANAVSAQNGNVAVINNGVQTITTQLTSGRYQPITVQKGIPVKWIIKAGEYDLNGCNNSIIIPMLNKEIPLKEGDNNIEFTPTESGTMPYSCWMGMIRSKITVVDDINNSEVDGSEAESEPGSPIVVAPNRPGDSVDYKIPLEKIAVAEISNGKQTVSIDMDENGFSPAVIVMQVGIETDWIINGVSIGATNRSLVFPNYYTRANMQQGENLIRLVPETDFDFSAIDYSFYGYVKVVDDIDNFDMDAIKQELGDYRPLVPSNFDYNPGYGYGGGKSGAPSCH